MSDVYKLQKKAYRLGTKVRIKQSIPNVFRTKATMRRSCRICRRQKHSDNLIVQQKRIKTHNLCTYSLFLFRAVYICNMWRQRSCIN